MTSFSAQLIPPYCTASSAGQFMPARSDRHTHVGKKDSFSKLTTKAKDRKWIPQWQIQRRAFHGEVRDMETMESSAADREEALKSRLSESGRSAGTGSQAPPPPKRLHVIKNIVGCRRPECYREKRRIMGHHYIHHRKCHRGWSAEFWVPEKSGELKELSLEDVQHQLVARRYEE